MDQFLTLEKAKLGPVFNSTAYIYIYIYIYAVELNAGPRFALSSVKNWSKFLIFFVFENLALPAERREFLENKNGKKTKTMTQFLC